MTLDEAIIEAIALQKKVGDGDLVANAWFLLVPIGEGCLTCKYLLSMQCCGKKSDGDEGERGTESHSWRLLFGIMGMVGCLQPVHNHTALASSTCVGVAQVDE